MRNPELILILTFLAFIAIPLAVGWMVFDTTTKHKKVISGARRDHQRSYVREQLGLDLGAEKVGS